MPNTSGVTRFGIDFRTVHLDDVVERNRAPNIDSACRTLCAISCGTNLTRLPEEIVATYAEGTDLHVQKRKESSNAQALGNLQRAGFTR